MGRFNFFKTGCVVAAATLVVMLAIPARAQLFTGSLARDEGAICAVDDVPAASLLLPYFEVDLSKVYPAAGDTTLFTINNASSSVVLTHVTIWSDMSVHVLDFNVYLTGYDVYRLNLQSILTTGQVNGSASTGQDPGDTISPKGPLSQDINFPNCNGVLPLGQIPGSPGSGTPFAGSLFQGIQQSLTGQASVEFGGKCAGYPHGDTIARGYITVDTVDRCSPNFADDPDYFQDVSGNDTRIATDQNVLWGDSQYINQLTNKAFAQNLVHIEADPTNPATSTSGRYTFYGRYDVPQWTASDHREPLATTFDARYLNGGAFSAGTTLIVWRDAKTDVDANTGFTCFTQDPDQDSTPPGAPGWFPLGQEGIVIFDEQEHPVVPPTCFVSPCPPPPTNAPFPIETQKVSVLTTGSTATPPPFEIFTPFNFGWIYLDLNSTVPGFGANPPVDPAADQAWVIAAYDNGTGATRSKRAVRNSKAVAGGPPNYEVGVRATQDDSACAAQHFVP